MKIIDSCIEYMASEPYMSKHALVWGIFCLFIGLSFFFFAILGALYPRLLGESYFITVLILALMGAFWTLVGKRLLQKCLVALFKKY